MAKFKGFGNPPAKKPDVLWSCSTTNPDVEVAFLSDEKEAWIKKNYVGMSGFEVDVNQDGYHTLFMTLELKNRADYYCRPIIRSKKLEAVLETVGLANKLVKEQHPDAIFQKFVDADPSKQIAAINHGKNLGYTKTVYFDRDGKQQVINIPE